MWPGTWTIGFHEPEADRKENRGQSTYSPRFAPKIESVPSKKLGADVFSVMQGRKNAVVCTFAGMEHAPKALPSEEQAPSTETMA